MCGDVLFEDSNYTRPKPSITKKKNSFVVRLFIALGLAKTKEQANTWMLIVSALCIVYISWSWFIGNEPPPEPPFNGGSNPEYRV
tara:strand:- start:1584 stop:1838 length:255 start_codon:yes stop_codon:yes gene_type:complete